MVNQTVLEGNWKEIKGRIREQWGQLTDDDLDTARGDAEQLLGMIETRTGQARERIEEFLEDVTAQASSHHASFKHQAQDYARQASEAAGEYGAQVQQAVEEGAEQLKRQARSGVAEAGRMVRRRPLESLATCFGAGLIAGVVIGAALRGK